MMKQILTAASLSLVLVLAVTATNAQASDSDIPSTAGELYAACKPVAGRQSFNLSDMALFKAGVCLGVIQTLRNQTGMNCLMGTPDVWGARSRAYDHSLGAVTLAFTNYAEKHPQYWKEPSVEIVKMALVDYFPC